MNETIKDNITDNSIQSNLKSFASNPNKQQEQTIARLKWFTGKIIDNNDPDKLGKCKVKVYGIFDDIPNEDIPWASPDFTYSGSTQGNFVVPPVNTIVRCYFNNNDIYLPHYTTKAISETLPDDYDEDYPNNMILFSTDNGDSLSVNRKTNLFTFRHASGTIITINASGQLNISANEINLESTGDISLTSSAGSINLEAETGHINLGKGASISVPNLPLDPVSNAPMAICGQFQGIPGSVRVKA